MRSATTAPARGARSRSSRRSTPASVALGLLSQLVFYLALLGIWETLVRTGVIDAFFFPAPIDIGADLVRLMSTGIAFQEAWTTATEMFIGLTIGAVLGIVSGLVLVRLPWLDRLTQPLMYFLYSIPRIALAPLFIVAFGLGIGSKVATVVFSVFFVLLINTTAGARSVGQEYVRSARALGATEGQITWMVIVPGTLAWIFSGLRLAVSLAFLSAVVAEFVGATGGLGYRLQIAAVYFNTVEIFAWLVVLGVFASLLNTVLGWIESKALRWRPEALA